MIVTINTDASFTHKFNRGSFAMWIVSNQGRLKQGGMLKQEMKTPWEAEMQAIVNAIYVLRGLPWINVHRVICNTDCLNAIHLFQNDVREIRYHSLLNKRSKKIVKRFISVSGPFRGMIEFRHVKAHSGKDDARSYVNEWLDREAKFHMGNFLTSKGVPKRF